MNVLDRDKIVIDIASNGYVITNQCDGYKEIANDFTDMVLKLADLCSLSVVINNKTNKKDIKN